jgi:3-oxoacyl-[acyl-carrier-protein] synthase-1
VGGLSASECEGLFSIEAEGSHLASLLSNSLERYNIAPADVGVVVAHGNGNKKSDISEARAIDAVFGELQVPVTAFKWAMGHTICASGILDVVLTTYVLQNNSIPGIANLEGLAADCQMLNASREQRAIAGNKPYALMISRGYASINACLVIRQGDG